MRKTTRVVLRREDERRKHKAELADALARTRGISTPWLDLALAALDRQGGDTAIHRNVIALSKRAAAATQRVREEFKRHTELHRLIEDPREAFPFVEDQDGRRTRGAGARAKHGRPFQKTCDLVACGSDLAGDVVACTSDIAEVRSHLALCAWLRDFAERLYPTEEDEHDEPGRTRLVGKGPILQVLHDELGLEHRQIAHLAHARSSQVAPTEQIIAAKARSYATALSAWKRSPTR